MARCSEDQACSLSGECVRAGFHANFAALQGPFSKGQDVTAACLDCHEEEAQEMLQSPHWLWTGPTPNVEGLENVTTSGKNDFVNNFCVSVPGNEARCAQCHAGYDYKDDTFDFTNERNIDCLVCHADEKAGYVKGQKSAGQPEPTVDLVLAAQSVGPTSVETCGSCHFYAGGGDNVKKGDLGSALEHPTFESDVHMGQGITCSNCHDQGGHVVRGQGVHLAVSRGRLDCAECHGQTVHATAGVNLGSMIDNHAIDVACQTCHIPSFSRQQPTKMDWDWSTAGNNTRGGGTGAESMTLADGTVVQSYLQIKGDFVWEKNVKPTFAWNNGRVSRVTLDTIYPVGRGGPESPVVLAEPLASIADADAKIYPFKVMTGRQPAHLADRYMIAPDLFGPGAFWAGVPPAGSYTPEAVRNLWTASLIAGAKLAGQIGANETIADNEWDFVNTVMYMSINHEVAPSVSSLGCNDCHGNPSFPWAELGYPGDCGSTANCGRH
ncbi:MAG: tetrathionate reductase family octaheme c-type cytochrome [Myxococcales bacterium]|nr:tetrathionate reductase family octaheme c-type cytochrome [Myxococcales bacterium]